MRAMIIFLLIMFTACVNYPTTPEPIVKENMSKGGLPSDKENLPQVSVPYVSGDIKLTLETPKRYYDIGEPVEFFLVKKNLGDTPKEIFDGHVTYHVLNENNEEIIRYSLITADDQIITLKPGEEYRARAVWNQIGAVHPPPPGSKYPQVPPDDYTIEWIPEGYLNITITIVESKYGEVMDEPQISEPYYDKSLKNFKFHFETDKQRYEIGEPIVITKVAENIGNTTAEYYDGYSDVVFFQVYNEQNEDISGSFLAPTGEIRIPILPHEIHKSQNIWRQLDSQGKQVPPGDYEIEVPRGGPRITISIIKQNKEA